MHGAAAHCLRTGFDLWKRRCVQQYLLYCVFGFDKLELQLCRLGLLNWAAVVLLCVKQRPRFELACPVTSRPQLPQSMRMETGSLGPLILQVTLVCSAAHCRSLS